MATRGPRARPPSSSRLASLLLVIGCLAVLGVTFALGVAAGRRWPNGLPGFGPRAEKTLSQPATAPVAPARGERDRRSETRGLDGKAKTVAEAPPVLTFYHELTAPLAPPSTTRAAAKPEASKPTARPAETTRHAVADPDASSRDKRSPSAAPAEPRFTVQVGAFRTRAQAEALRARLAESGQETYVTEVATDGAPQYRVRVGTFATREAARDAATRLGHERQLATYVTTR